MANRDNTFDVVPAAAAAIAVVVVVFVVVVVIFVVAAVNVRTVRFIFLRLPVRACPCSYPSAWLSSR